MNPTNKSGSKLINDFQIQKLLGTGAFGAVLKCQNQGDKLTYAIKVTGAVDVNALREVQNLVKIPSHQNLVKYYTCWKDELKMEEVAEIKKSIRLDSDGIDKFRIPFGQTSLKIICIQMELCSQDLRNWLNQQKEMNSTTTMDIFAQICNGLEHIHKNGIIHRDLKPENIFLSKSLTGSCLVVKIGDLGIATGHIGTNSANHTSGSGTRLYFAPEQERSRYGKTVDIYALGIILFELLNPSIQPGFNHNSFERLIATVTDLKFKQLIPFSMKTRWPTESDLILKLTSVNSSDRPNFAAIRQSLANKSPGQLKAANKFADLKPLVVAPKPLVNPEKLVDKQPVLPSPKVLKVFEGAKKGPALPAPPALKACYKCKKLIANQNFVIVLGQFYCLECNQNRLKPSDSKCVKCLKPIIEGSGGHTVYKNQKWHMDCMKCINCRRVISKEEFFNKEDKLYCLNCNKKLFCPKCFSCKKPITGTITSFEDRKWHEDCFKCQGCKKLLRKDDKFFPKATNIYCIPCKNEKFAPKCFKCKKPITTKHTNYNNETWHDECFTCFKCKTSIAGQKFYLKGLSPYCTLCHSIDKN